MATFRSCFPTQTFTIVDHTEVVSTTTTTDRTTYPGHNETSTHVTCVPTRDPIVAKRQINSTTTSSLILIIPPDRPPGPNCTTTTILSVKYVPPSVVTVQRPVPITITRNETRYSVSSTCSTSISPSPIPVSPSPIPISPSPIPVSPSPIPVSPSPIPISPSPIPVSPSPIPVSPSPIPISPSPIPVSPSPIPISPSPIPVSPSPIPISPSPIPVSPSPIPISPSPIPVSPSPIPVSPSPIPISPSPIPVSPSPIPISPSPIPVSPSPIPPSSIPIPPSSIPPSIPPSDPPLISPSSIPLPPSSPVVPLIALPSDSPVTPTDLPTLPSPAPTPTPLDPLSPSPSPPAETDTPAPTPPPDPEPSPAPTPSLAPSTPPAQVTPPSPVPVPTPSTTRAVLIPSTSGTPITFGSSDAFSPQLPDPTASASSVGSTNDVRIIVGSVIGGLAALALIGIAGYYFLFKKAPVAPTRYNNLNTNEEDQPHLQRPEDDPHWGQYPEMQEYVNSQIPEGSHQYMAVPTSDTTQLGVQYSDAQGNQYLSVQDPGASQQVNSDIPANGAQPFGQGGGQNLPSSHLQVQGQPVVLGQDGSQVLQYNQPHGQEQGYLQHDGQAQGPQPADQGQADLHHHHYDAGGNDQGAPQYSNVQPQGDPGYTDVSNQGAPPYDAVQGQGNFIPDQSGMHTTAHAPDYVPTVQPPTTGLEMTSSTAALIGVSAAGGAVIPATAAVVGYAAAADSDSGSNNSRTPATRRLQKPRR